MSTPLEANTTHEEQTMQAGGMERFNSAEARQQLQERYGLNEHEIKVMSEVHAEYYPHLARLIIYRAQQIADEKEREDFLRLWQAGLSEVWGKGDIDLRGLAAETPGEMGELRIAQLFNAYQPKGI